MYFNATTTSLGWNKGIWFDLGGGAAPIRSTGTVIGFAGSWTVANVIEASSITASNSFITGPGFSFVVDGSGNTQIAASANYSWVGLSKIISPGDGVMTLTDHTDTTFSRLELGGTTSAFPAIKRNGAAINFRLADDSADASITAGGATLTGNLNTATIQIGTVAPTGNNLIQIGVGSATGRFIDIKNSLGEAQYGLDAAGSAYAWCVTCASTIFGTQAAIPVDFYANNLKTLTILPGTISVADATVWVRASTPSSSSATGGLLVAGGAGIAGAIYGGAEVTTGVTAVGTLPACNAARKGAHHFVNDSNAASYTAGIGTIVATGGTTNVPVTCDGTNWRIG
jgi:hypothetical protein